MVKKEKNHISSLLNKFASRRVITTVRSELNPVLEVLELGGKRMLNSANTNYSYGGLHRVFQKAFEQLEIVKRAPKKVLVLGFGCGSVASILQSELGLDCNITGIEKDASVIEIGDRYFDTDKFRNTTIYQEDASEFMTTLNDEFDLIIVDVYVDFEVPDSCQTDEFVGDLSRSLSPGGMVIYNKLIYNHELGEKAKELLAKFEKLNGKTRMIKIKENIVNRIIVFENQATQI